MLQPLSLGNLSVEQFRQRIAQSDSTPAGVSAAAVSASVAVALLDKVLRVVSNRGTSPSAVAAFTPKRRAAQRLVTALAQYADDDVAAFQSYTASRSLPQTTPAEREQRERAMQAAVREAVEVPLNLARACVEGLSLCCESAPLVNAFITADLGAAGAMLAGAAHATFLIIDFNVAHFAVPEQFAREILTEKAVLQSTAVGQAHRLEQQVTARLRS